MLLHLAALSTFLLLLPMMLLSLLTAILTTLLSSAVLGVRLAVGYSGLFMAMVRRCVGAFLFPRVGYLVVKEEGVGEPRFEMADPRLVNCRTTTEKELAVAVASLKVKVMSRNVGRRRRSGAPMGAMRVDYGTLLRSPKGREDSFGR